MEGGSLSDSLLLKDKFGDLSKNVPKGALNIEHFNIPRFRFKQAWLEACNKREFCTGQKLHVAGEGSSKNSAVLCPCALTKFDFDNGLQGDLRFDSLVDNEVFLGIPSEEDDHWIEDFSCGSSGIEFSSSAAESCSISRHINIWSEATSSESVEILLKSVGQEEIVQGDAFVEESDACHEFGSLTEQMEPHMKQDAKVMDVVDSDPALQSDELLDHSSSVNNVESISQTQEAEISTRGSSDLLDPKASSGTCGVIVMEYNPGVNETNIEVNTSGNEYMNDRVQKKSSSSGMQIGDIGSSSQDNSATVGVLINQEPENQVCDVHFENANCLLTDTSEVVGEHHVLSKEIVMVDQILEGAAFETGTHNVENLPGSPSKVEIVGQHTVETGISNFEKPCSLPLKGGCNLQIVESCNEGLYSTNPVCFQGESNLEGSAVEISNMKAGFSACSELKMDQTTHVENLSGEGKDNLYRKASVSNSEASLFSEKDSKVLDGQGDGSNCNYVRDHPSVTVACSSAEFHGQKPTAENIDAVDDANGLHKEDLNAGDGVSFATETGSLGIHKGNLGSNPSDSINTECYIVESLSSDKKVEPLSEVNNAVVHGSDCETTEGLSEVNPNVPGLELEKGTLHNSALELSHDAVDQSLPALKTWSLVSGSERNGKLSHRTVGLSSPMAEPSSIESQSTSVKSHENHEAAAVDHEVASFKNAGEGSFTFQVYPSRGLPERETSKDAQSFPSIQSSTVSMTVKPSPSAPGVGQMGHTVLDLSPGSSQPPEGEIARGVSKGTAERKRRPSGKATGKENAKKENTKETSPLRQSERGVKSRGVTRSPSSTAQLMRFEGLNPHGNVDCSGTIPSALNQQSFTDLQQVQLRAQIFVYGSMIQGAIPDEACMVSAFGASDGGRSAWEPVWRACVERLRVQKSHSSKSENPVQARSGSKPGDQSIKQDVLQSKVLSSHVGQASSKATPSPVLNSMIPLSSPLWNISTPSCDGLQASGMPRTSPLDYRQTPSSLHSFQSPPPRSFVGLNTSWLSQAPFPVPWVASPQTSGFDFRARLSALPITETVNLNPVKESSAPFSSGTKDASHSSTVVHSQGPSTGTPCLPDMKKVTVSSGQNTTDTKARKRKKATASDDLSKIPFFARTQTESVSIPLVTSHLSTSVVVSTPACFVSKGNASKIVPSVPPTFSEDTSKSGQQNSEQKATLSEDTNKKVEEAKRQAEDAAVAAAAAVSQSENVWDQLNKQKSAGLIPDVGAKLASAAVTIAAAASVAKAAAAAANIASTAALQARLMADEALVSSVTSNPQSNAISDFVNLGRATPASILKGGDGRNSSSSIIVAAREAARRRVEAASTASKHAENLGAIVKAAELAAEAVSQAGKIVAMGDPSSLNELVEAGPEAYLRVPQIPPEQSDHTRQRSEVGGIEGLSVSSRRSKEGPLEEEANTTNRDMSPLSRDVSRESMESMRAVGGVSVSGSFTSGSGEMGSRGKRTRRTSDLAKSIKVIPESEIGSRPDSIPAQDENGKQVGTLKKNNIKEGCLVEVYKDGDEFKAAWYSANVLSLKDGKAFVVYSDIQSENGSRQLEEWVALEGEGNSAPRIRIAHNMTALSSEGNRKRRRAARGDNTWSVGDRVDAWIHDCWREGVVTEKNNKDDATLTVHFPAEGERSVVRQWDLRPTLIWKGGEWIEWSTSRERDPSSKGDTPQEKRLKLGSSSTGDKKKNITAKNIDHVESRKSAESGLLPLSDNENISHAVNNTGTEIKPDALGTVRSGPHKEGSRVIFGVPKPGKKRKFMDVSKHDVSERTTKTNEPNESIKLTNYLMRQGSGPRGWRNTKFEAKAKQLAESNPKVLKSGKLPSVSGRSLPPTGKILTSSQSAQNEGTEMDHFIEDSISTDKMELGQQNVMGFGSFSKTDGAAEGPVAFSSLALPSHARSKKKPTSKAKSEQVNKGKLAPSTGKLGKVEVKEKLESSIPGISIPDVSEPRRSNRRIQPTSRLLEGLQSSLMISKIPAVPHDKSHRSQNSEGDNQG